MEKYANKIIINNTNEVYLKAFFEDHKMEIKSLKSLNDAFEIVIETENLPVSEELIEDLSEDTKGDIFSGYISSDLKKCGYSGVINGKYIDEVVDDTHIEKLVNDLDKVESNEPKDITNEVIEISKKENKMENVKVEIKIDTKVGIATYGRSSKYFQTNVTFSRDIASNFDWNDETKLSVTTVNYKLKTGGSKKVMFVSKSLDGNKIMVHGKNLFVSLYNVRKQASKKVNYEAVLTNDGFYVVLEENDPSENVDSFVGANDNKGETAPKFKLSKAEDYIRSIQPGYPGWKARLKIIKGEDLSLMEAGDECYTPSDLIDCGLKAEGVNEYDFDACSMNDQGEYPYQSRKNRNNGYVREWKGVPAKLHMTKDCSNLGSLGVEWSGKIGWCNPPYGKRAWISWLEKANYEVEQGRVEKVVCLVSDDVSCHAQSVMNTPNGFDMRLEKQILFYKPDSEKNNLITNTAGNMFMIYGKPSPSHKEFLKKFINEVVSAGYISREYADYKITELDNNKKFD